MNKSQRDFTPHSGFDIPGRLVARNTILNLFGLGLPLLVGFLTLPYIIRWLGTERFGILSLVWLILGYFGIFDFGMGQATTKFIAEALGKGEIKNISKYLWSTVIFQAILGICGTVILVVITPFAVSKLFNIPAHYVEQTKIVFYLIGISLPIVQISSSFRGVLEAGQRFDLVNAVKIPASITNYILPLLVLMFGYGLKGIVISLIASRAMALIFWIYFSFKNFPLLRVKIAFHMEAFRPLITYGGWLTLVNILWPVMISLDRFFIGALINMNAVAYYSAPVEIVNRVGIIPGSLVMVLFPTFSALSGKNERARINDFYAKSMKYICLSIGPLVMLAVFFARDILRLWLGEDFADHSTFVLQILLITLIFSSLGRVASTFIQGIGRVDLTAKFLMFELLLYVPLLWIFLKKWGISGVGAAWFIRVIIDTILLFWVSRKIGEVEFSYFKKNNVYKAVFVLFMFTLAGYFLSLLIMGYLFILLAVGVFSVICWVHILDDNEKRWLRGFLRARF